MRVLWAVLLTGAIGFLSACGGGDGSKAPLASAPDSPGPVGTTDPAPTPDPGPDSGPVAGADPVPPPVNEPGPVGGVHPRPFPGLVDLPTPAGPFEPLTGSLLERFPLDQIVSGGVPKDGIPALTNPAFVRPDQIDYMGPDDLILGMVVNGQAKAYPHNIGWWHEIVNDRVGGHPICVTFCPLTGTGLVFDGMDVNGQQFELGVSGLLFNNNLIMYDRRDNETLYPQIFSAAVQGPRTGETLTLLPAVETTWSTWQRLHPETQVISGDTGTPRNYTRYPYGNYRVDHQFLIFGLNPSLLRNPNPFATQYERKDGLLGVRLNGDPKAYPFAAMGTRRVLNDQVGGVDIAVVWDADSQLAIPYARRVDGQALTFDLDESTGFPFSLVDRETGTRWTVLGEAVDGPLAGRQLTQVPAHNSFWFAWVTFWQDTDVWSL